MPRYIDTEDFKHLINASSLYGTEEWVKVMNLLADTPTADVVELKQGTWIFEDRKPVNRRLKTNEFAYCDQCGGTAPGYPFWEGDLELTKFCPHCGARML